MPIYEYQCGSCGHRLEALQGLNDSPLTDCPECGTGALAKLISVTGFQLKGTGWYRSDYAKKPRQSEMESEDGASCGQGASATD